MAKYKIISDGKYMELKDSYEAGEIVQFKFPYATDNTYFCTINGCLIYPTVSDGYLIYDFIMPERDVKIEVHSKSTMFMRIDENGKTIL